MRKPPTERVVAELRGYSNRSGASEYEHEVYGRAADTIVAQAAENARLRELVEADAEELDHRRRFMDREGYRRCDVPECNCPYWHGGHASERLREIGEALGDLTQGVTLLRAVETLIYDAETARLIEQHGREWVFWYVTHESGQWVIEGPRDEDTWDILGADLILGKAVRAAAKIGWE